MLVVSVIASAITAKIVATYYFKKVEKDPQSSNS